MLTVTGFDLSRREQDDLGNPLPAGVAVGIAGDCSGGLSPWGTILSAEENVQDYYGDLETSWTSRQRFIRGVGFDPGDFIQPTFEASPGALFTFHSNTAQLHHRDGYGFVAEMDAGEAPSNFYESIGTGGDGSGHRKIGSMGRARWENAMFVTDGEFKLIPGQPVVIYGANDRRGGRIYKWYSEKPYEKGMTKAQVRALLDTGSLFIAHFDGLENTDGITLHATGELPTESAPGRGRWIHMSVNSTDIAPNAAALGAPGTTVGQALRDVNWNGIGGFRDDNDVRTALYTAANKIGVMELNRPEDVEWNPSDPSGTPRAYVAFTKHGRQVALDQDGVLFDPDEQPIVSPTRPDPDGSIFAMEEADPANPAASFELDYFAVWVGSGGKGPFDVANPDNLMIDRDGGVWFGTDGNFGRNGTADALYYLDLDPSNRDGESGVQNPTFGIAFRVAAGPDDSESTGPAFSSDMKTIFFNV